MMSTTSLRRSACGSASSLRRRSASRDSVAQREATDSKRPQYRDLRAARALLFKYTALQHKLDQEKGVVAKLNELCDGLGEKNRAEREAAEAKYQELAQKRMDEMETAMSTERNLRERLDETEREWR